MTYAVIYGNYFPREVDSYWPTKEQAEAHRDKLNSEGRTCVWDIEEIDIEVEPATLTARVEEIERENKKLEKELANLINEVCEFINANGPALTMLAGYNSLVRLRDAITSGLAAYQQRVKYDGEDKC